MIYFCHWYSHISATRKMFQSYELKLSFRTYVRIVWWRQRKAMTRCRFDNSSSEPKDRSNFPNKWALRSFRYDDKGTVDKKRAPRQKDTARWRTPFTVANSLPSVEIDRRFGSVARGCRAFDRFTQDRLLVPTHVLNVLACRWTCTYDGPWNPVRHGICNVISSCNLPSKSSSARDRERDILGKFAKMQFIWYVYTRAHSYRFQHIFIT